MLCGNALHNLNIRAAVGEVRSGWSDKWPLLFSSIVEVFLNYSKNQIHTRWRFRPFYLRGNLFLGDRECWSIHHMKLVLIRVISGPTKQRDICFCFHGHWWVVHSKNPPITFPVRTRNRDWPLISFYDKDAASDKVVWSLPSTALSLIKHTYRWLWWEELLNFNVP